MADNPTLNGAEYPLRTFFFTWQVCQGLGLVQAREVLAAAAKMIQAYLDSQPDPVMQAVYLARVEVRPLWAAWQARSTSL